VAIEIRGDFKFRQTEIPFDMTKLGNRVYGSARAPFGGKPAVWVGTTDPLTQTTKISFQVTAKPPRSAELTVSRPVRFDAVLSLPPPPAEEV
jgi:hypothetical protein